MKCPYCNNELKPGWIRSDSEIFWSEKKTKVRANLWDDLLVSQSFFFIDSVPADYCQACKKIIIKLENENNPK